MHWCSCHPRRESCHLKSNVPVTHITHTLTTHTPMFSWGLKPHQNRHFWGEIQAREKERAKDIKKGKRIKCRNPQPEHSFTGRKEKEDKRVRTGIIYHSQPNQWTQKHLHVQMTQQNTWTSQETFETKCWSLADKIFHDNTTNGH